MTQRKVLAALVAVGVLASTTAAHAQTGRAAAPATAWADTQAFVGFSANGAFFDNTYVMRGVWAAAADFSLALRPRFRVHRMLQLRAYWGLSVAHTGDTTTRNEASLSDATVALWFDGIPAVGGLRVDLASWLTAPVSARSRANTMILGTGLLAQAHWNGQALGGTLRLIGRVGLTHLFHEYATPSVRGELPYVRIGGAGQLSGVTNVSDALTWDLVVTQAWGMVSPGASFGMQHQWSLDVSPSSGGSSALVGAYAQPQMRTYTSFALWLDVSPTSWLTLEAGYTLTRSLLDADGTYGDPFFARYQDWRVYLSASVVLDRLFDGRAHPERGIVRW